MRLLPPPLLLPLSAVLLSCPWPRAAQAQTEATFSVPSEAPAPGDSGTAEGEPTEPSTEATPDKSATEQSSPSPERTPKPPASPAAAEPNPYGTPSARPPFAPSPPIPGNPYGSVAYRPVTPDENPYPDQHPGTQSKRATKDQTHWSLGGGLLWESSRDIGGGWTAFYLRENRITPSLLFERRLSHRLHLMFQPLLNYRKARQERDDDPTDKAVVEELRMALEAGIRWVANPGAAVEVGMSHVLTGGFNQLIVEEYPNYILTGASDLEADQLVLGLGNSLLAERQLVPRLWLRMGVGLVGVSYAATTIVEHVEEEDETTGEVVESERESSESAFLLGLSPSFAMQLRLTF